MSALKKYRDASRSGQGGPTSQEQLRALMRQQDRAKFIDLQRKGYDPMGQEFAPTVGGADAQLLTPDLDPAVQFAPYRVEAVSQPIDPAQEAERIRSDLRWRSWQTPRGQQMRLDNLENDAALRARIDHLKNAPMPADYSDGDFSMRKRYLDVLRYLTGQGGGMR